MKRISLLEFRTHTERILAQIERGERIILTRRGKPVARLEPIVEVVVDADDPFYSICNLATDGEPLDSAQIDELLYGR
jgi:prevent-host-death family protein